MMTRRIAILLMGGLLLSGAAPAWAEVGCRANEKLSLIGSVATGSGYGGTPEVVVTRAAEVRLIVTSCGASACQWGVYDATTRAGATTANARIEPSGAANSGTLLPQTGFFEQPLTFNNGIVVFNSGNNGSSIAFYECTERP